MSEYRQIYHPGGTYFFTLVTYNRQPIFDNPKNISLLRQATTTIKAETPFDIIGAVILPDHLHFIWALPPDDTNYSKRIGRLKMLFTQSLLDTNSLHHTVSLSRRKHRESNIGQRRFWEHLIRDEKDFELHLDYIHYNPVKHGLVICPHFWKYSSLDKWTKQGVYAAQWCCICQSQQILTPKFEAIAQSVRE